MASTLINSEAISSPTQMSLSTYTLSSLNDIALIDSGSFTNVTVDTRGTFVAALAFEGSIDRVNWVPLYGSIANAASIGTPITSATGPSMVSVFCGSVRWVRVRVSAYTSGSATVSLCSQHSTKNHLIEGPVTVGVTSSSTDPVIVNPAERICLGRQTLSVTTGAVSTLTVPGGSLAATIQADGTAVSITLDGTTPTASIGSRIDDGVFFYCDTVLSNVKLIARFQTTNVQVAYFNRA